MSLYLFYRVCLAICTYLTCRSMMMMGWDCAQPQRLWWMAVDSDSRHYAFLLDDERWQGDVQLFLVPSESIA